MVLHDQLNATMLKGSRNGDEDRYNRVHSQVSLIEERPAKVPKARYLMRFMKVL